MKIVPRIKEILEERGISQKELSIMTGLRHANINEMANQKRSTINIKSLELVAGALKVKSIEELLVLSPEYKISYIPENTWYAQSSTKPSSQFIRWRNTLRGIVIDAIALDTVSKSFYHSNFTYEDISYYELIQKFNSLNLEMFVVDESGVLRIQYSDNTFELKSETSEFIVLFNLCDNSSTHKKFNYPKSWLEKKSNKIDEEKLKELEL